MTIPAGPDHPATLSRVARRSDPAPAAVWPPPYTEPSRIAATASTEWASTLIASQLPVTDWHGGIGDPNQADAICDRLLHDAHRLELKGASMRRTKAAPKTPAKATP